MSADGRKYYAGPLAKGRTDVVPLRVLATVRQHCVAVRPGAGTARGGGPLVSNCYAIWQLDYGQYYGQDWHCLRPPKEVGVPTPGIPVDLPTKERDRREGANVEHRLGTLTTRDSRGGRRSGRSDPVPKGIFNSRAAALTLALIQISGATASLAKTGTRTSCRIGNEV
jgi:hypothetical protein